MDDLLRARALARLNAGGGAPTISPQLQQLLALVPQTGAVPGFSDVPQIPGLGSPGGNDPLARLLKPYNGGNLFGGLQGGPITPVPGAGGFPGVPSGGGTPGGGGGNFTASAPGQDFRGYDLTPDLVNFQGVETVRPYARLIRAAEKKLGMPEISEYAGSDYRSHDEQAALYASHLAGTHPAPVAPPGQSYHEQGEAIDWNTAWLAAHPEVRDFLTSHGVVFDVPGEPWHGHLASAPHVGKILSGGRPRRRSAAPPMPRRPTGGPVATATRPRRRSASASLAFASSRNRL
jgi:hypothetical protein